jgi:Ca2+-binding EF-hand superfamily protein
LKDNTLTESGKINLTKLKNIRNTLRRKYCTRKNFKKIFELWDEDSTGLISVTNFCNTMRKMGIFINMDEAKLLVASADKDGSKDLNLHEFMDFVYKDDPNFDSEALERAI